ncbi:MAG: 4,5-DOPA-extradiol-dioxygenase [Bdellovibrionota bacterium]
MKNRAPVIFVGHGSPMNAIADNDFTRSLRELHARYPQPRAILVISAHWMTEGTWVTHMANPKTIHDFYGFPPALFDIRYNAPGSPAVADLVRATVKSPRIQPDDEMWGLDHGTWSVLRHIFPAADIPVLQLSLDIAQPAPYHLELGRQLRTLRDQSVLIIASGNIVHNLRKIRWEEDAAPFDWALEFDAWTRDKLRARDEVALSKEYLAFESGRLSVPTADHYLPLLYALGASDSRDELRFTFEGIQNASISMRSMVFGN